MKIGIVTQPLIANYGGFLQAWALQEQLRQMGHEPQTIDYLPGATPWYLLVRSWIKTIALLCIGKRRPFVQRRPAVERIEMFDKFARNNMSLTKRVHSYKSSLVNEYGFDAVITGSDQVWRPIYNKYLQDMFLSFVKKPNIKKIAYAASFGVDNWEFTPEHTKSCGRLAKKLDAISVRESSGVALCKNHLDVDAIEVLDPTLLHGKEDYEKLCADIPKTEAKYLASYVLDLTPEKKAFIEHIAQQQNLPLRIFSAYQNAKLTIEEWLAIYRDAQYVVTDSFHGTVFSILFHKPFLSIVNKRRGASRFYSLLQKLGLENCMVTSIKDVPLIVPQAIDWIQMEQKLAQHRLFATHFLQTVLAES